VLAAWLLYPAVALAVALGIGLAVDRAAGTPLPGVLLLPVGFAGIVALTQVATTWDTTAELTIPVTLGVSLVGWLVGYKRLSWLALDKWALAAALGVFIVFAAPTVGSGEAAFAGYTVLGDTSIHMIGADALPRIARHFSVLAPSSYEYSLAQYYGVGYPAGGATAAGFLTSIVHQDVAWTFQCFLALLVVCMSLALWSLAEPVVSSRPLRALVTFVAAQPALVLAYSLQGSVKEVGTGFAVATLAALIVPYVRSDRAARRAIPLAVAAAAALGIVGPAAAVWLGPLLLGTLVAAVIARGARSLPGDIAVFVAAGAALSVQTLGQLSGYVEVSRVTVTTQGEVGNLFGPLRAVQMFGIWIVGDYRVRPDGVGWLFTRIGIVLAVLAAIVGIAVALRRWRAGWSLLLYVGVSVVGWAYVTRTGSTWADGKALMIVSPAVVLIVMVGAASLAAWRRPAVALGAALALGVLASNALAYHDVSMAPRDRMAELAEIGHMIDGKGPTLYAEFEEFGKHFLRQGDPEGASEGLQRRYALRNPGLSRFGYNSDADTFSPEYVGYYRMLVLRRGFEGSRPSSIYRRVWSGRFYDLWERAPGSERQVIAHLPVGDLYNPAVAPTCGTVRDFARQAGPGARLRYVPRAPSVLMNPVSAKRYPSGWFADPADPTISLRTNGPGRVDGRVVVPSAGTYTVWLSGSIGRPLRVLVDGRDVGSVAYELNNRGTSDFVGRVKLTAGTHTVSVVRGGGSLRAGSGGDNRVLSLVALSPQDVGDLPVREIAASDYREICGQTVDWVEAVRG
jgi:hypothetical protein